MTHASAKHRRRNGVVAPLTAILLIPILAMIAYSVDLGYLVTCQSDLQNTADAAALAGAQKLMDNYGSYLSASGSNQSSAIKTAVTQAVQAAKDYASYNVAGGVNITLNGTDGTDGDIQVGNWNPSTQTFTVYTTSTYPDTVLIQSARLDDNPNAAVKLFFAPVLGFDKVSLQARAQATCFGGPITDFTGAGNLLPVAVNAQTYYAFVADPTNPNVADPNAPSGQNWFQIYPGGLWGIGGNSSGNGLLSLDGTMAPSDPHYSGSSGWVQAGPSSTEVTDLHTEQSGFSSADLPLPGDGTTGTTWASGPGMKSNLQSDFAAVQQTGTIRILPLFDPSSSGTGGNGSSGTYQIVAFVPVYIAYAESRGKANMDVAVSLPQGPYVLTDPTVIVSQSPLGSIPSTVNSALVVLVQPRLTQ
jgi:Flp pilus assembly protein TadG